MGLLLTASFSSTVINAKVHALVDVTTMDTQSLVPNESSKECKNNFEKKIFSGNILTSTFHVKRRSKFRKN